MKWDIRFTFKDKSDADYRIIDNEFLYYVKNYNLNGVVEETDHADDIRFYQIARFSRFLRHMKGQKYIPEDGYGYSFTIKGNNKNEVKFWTNFEKSLSDDVMNNNDIEIFFIDDKCPFCEIVSQGVCEIDDDYSVAYFEPLNPVVDGHTLFIPTVHTEHRMDGGMGSISMEQVMYVAHQYATERESDFNLITSSGSSATQTIDHIHVHYIPRLENDGLKLPWTGQVKSNT